MHSVTGTASAKRMPSRKNTYMTCISSICGGGSMPWWRPRLITQASAMPLTSSESTAAGWYQRSPFGSQVTASTSTQLGTASPSISRRIQGSS